jgi:regulator of nucleoside diphosphate kinase
MSQDACTLTTKDFTILEVMLDRCQGRDDPMADLLTRKINGALVVFRDDVPGNVATLSSRVVFSVDGREPDTRIVSHDRMTSPIGLFLPITTPRGLALLGLTEGQSIRIPGQDGQEELVLLEKVLYQPEESRREREALARHESMRRGKPVLRLVRNVRDGLGDDMLHGAAPFDDPGPSAA